MEALLHGPRRIPSASKRVAIGIPAELLRRRPDIHAAELNAAAESARIGVAEADLYPRFFLLGDVGVQSSDVAKLFAPHSLFFTAGPGFQWSILNYGRITNNVRAQDARFQQALVNYEDTVLKAAREVEDALIAFLKEQDSAVSSQKSVEAAQSSVHLAFIRYREGEEDFQRVVDLATRALAGEKQAGPDTLRDRDQPHRALQGLGRRMGNTRGQTNRSAPHASRNGEPHQLGRPAAGGIAAADAGICLCRRRPASRRFCCRPTGDNTKSQRA